MNNNIDKQPLFINRSNFELTVQRNWNLVNVNREVLEMNRGRWGPVSRELEQVHLCGTGSISLGTSLVLGSQAGVLPVS